MLTCSILILSVFVGMIVSAFNREEERISKRSLLSEFQIQWVRLLAEVMKIRSFEELYGFRFATLELRLLDYPEEPHFEAKVLLDTLYSPSPSLTRDQYRSLYQQVSEDYADVASKVERMELIRKDPYLSALQVKFAYALTCHKAQGGQWKAVFVDQGYLKEDQVDQDFTRWLYTAITRATEELYLVNFNPMFFVKSVGENE